MKMRRLLLAAVLSLAGLSAGASPASGDDVPPGQCKRLPNEQAGCPVVPPGQCEDLPAGQQKKFCP